MCSCLTESFAQLLIYRMGILVAEYSTIVRRNSSNALEKPISLVASDLSMLFSTIKLLNYMRLELSISRTERFSIFDYVLLMVNCEKCFVPTASAGMDMICSFINFVFKILVDRSQIKSGIEKACVTLSQTSPCLTHSQTKKI